MQAVSADRKTQSAHGNSNKINATRGRERRGSDTALRWQVHTSSFLVTHFLL